MTMVNELRHLDGIKGNMYLSETGYLAPATFHERGTAIKIITPLSQENSEIVNRINTRAPSIRILTSIIIHLLVYT